MYVRYYGFSWVLWVSQYGSPSVLVCLGLPISVLSRTVAVSLWADSEVRNEYCFTYVILALGECGSVRIMAYLRLCFLEFLLFLPCRLPFLSREKCLSHLFPPFLHSSFLCFFRECGLCSRFFLFSYYRCSPIFLSSPSFALWRFFSGFVDLPLVLVSSVLVNNSPLSTALVPSFAFRPPIQLVRHAMGYLLRGLASCTRPTALESHNSCSFSPTRWSKEPNLLVSPMI